MTSISTTTDAATTRARGDHYTAAHHAAVAMQRNPTDAAAFAQYVRCLLGLGLGRAAMRFIERARQSIGPESELGNALAQMLTIAERCPAGVVPWAIRAKCFSANLDALRPRYAELCDTLAAAATAGRSRYEIHRAQDGNWQIFDTQTLRWCGGLADHRVDATSRFQGPNALNVAATTAFDGVGVGALFGEFMQRSRRTFLTYSAAVVLVETDPLALALAMHLHDWRELLSEPRLHVFIGAEAEADAIAWLDADPCRPLPMSVQRVILTDRPPTSLHVSLGGVLERRTVRKARLVHELNNRQPARDVTYWARRYVAAAAGEAPPLRVLGLTSRYTTVLQYSIRELLDAAERAGCQTQLVMEPNDHSNDSDMVGRIAAFDPDLIVQLSRMRYEYPELPRNVPFISWDQDNLGVMRTEQATKSLDRLTFVAGHGAWHGRIHLGWPDSQALPVAPVIAAAVQTYSAEPVSAALRERYACDFSLVSHCSDSPESLRGRALAAWREHDVLGRIFESASQRVLDESRAGRNWTHCQIYGLVRECAAAQGVELRPAMVSEMYLALYTLADRAFRHCTLEWVADYAERTGRTLRLYGNGWELHPRFGRFAAGRAEFGEHLRAIYQATRINLQVIESGFLHSRSVDGLSAGGFFLARRTDYDRVNAAIGVLGAHVDRTGIDSLPRLLESTDASVRTAIEYLTPRVDWSAAEMWPWIRKIRDRLNPHSLFEDFERITFDDAASFAARADEFLNDDAARAKIVDRMRRVVVEQLSYDATWQRFVTFIRKSLAAGASSSA